MRFFQRKPHVQKKSGSGVMGQKGCKSGSNRAPKRPFRYYLKKSCPDFPDFMHVSRSRQWLPYATNRTHSPFLVLDLWAKKGAKFAGFRSRKGSFSIISKSHHQISLIFCMLIEPINALLLVKTARPAKIWFQTQNPKGVHNMPEFDRFGIFSKSHVWNFLILCM